MDKRTKFGIIGFLLGIPLSYFFQPEKLRAYYSITKYLAELPNLIASKQGDFLSPILITCVITTVLGVIVGIFIRQKDKES